MREFRGWKPLGAQEDFRVRGSGLRVCVLCLHMIIHQAGGLTSLASVMRQLCHTKASLSAYPDSTEGDLQGTTRSRSLCQELSTAQRSLQEASRCYQSFALQGRS